MSAAYTWWTHHGESANDGNVKFSEQAHPHEYDSRFVFQDDDSQYYDGIHVAKEPNDGNQEILDLEMISDLYAAAEEDG